MRRFKVHYFVKFETFLGSGRFKDGAACGNRLASDFAKESTSEVTCENCRKYYLRTFRITYLHPDTPNVSSQNELRGLLNEFYDRYPQYERELADNLKQSISSIRRWVQGKNLPHVRVAESINKYLRKQLAG